MPFFSIIIPVYNVAPYLRECLDSVVAQTFTDWEAICVDDGSTDGSGAILDEYAAKDKRIRIFHEVNGGVSFARNHGVDNASGEWIWVVDGCDVIHPQALDHIASTLSKHAEIDAYAHAGCLYGTDLPTLWPVEPDTDIEISTSHGYKNFMHFCREVWGVLYRREKFAKHKFKPMSVGGDALFWGDMYWDVSTFAFETVPLYFHRQGRDCKAGCEVSVAYVGSSLVALRQIVGSILRSGEWTHEELHSFLAVIEAHKDGFARLSVAGQKLLLKDWIALQSLLVSCGEAMKYVRVGLWMLRVIPSGRLAGVVARNVLKINNRSFLQLAKLMLNRCGCKMKPFTRRLGKPMRLGVAYNLFDGEELLVHSIRSIRDNVDFICVVYQDVSNSGEKRLSSLRPFLEALMSDGYIDSIVLFEPPRHLSRQECEKTKRLLGIKECKKNGCTHFLDMDADEFYRAEELRQARQFVVDNDIDVSAVSIIEYVKSPTVRLVSNYMFAPCDNPVDYVLYVPFICRITEKPYVGLFPCLADPTRGIFRQGRFFLFPKHRIAMHHMSTVRKDLALKFRNSTAHSYLSHVAVAVTNFDFDKSRSEMPKGYGFLGRYLVEEVPNEFGIDV